MKKAIALIVSLLFVFAVAGLSFAQEKKEAEPATAKAEKKMDEKKHAKKTGHYVHGEVTAVDAAASTLTVKGKKGEVTLTIDDKTKFHMAETLADVKVGEKLTAKYSETDGKMMATSVTMSKAHHHKNKEIKQGEEKEK